jgi:cytochrome c biogenesis protein
MKLKDNLQNHKKKPNVLLAFFSSLKLTIALLILIALLFVAGSIIPQQQASFEFIGRIPEGWASVLERMQFFDIYHSIWFFVLLGFLSLNLMVCSLNRFPVTWKSFRAKVFTDMPISSEKPPGEISLTTDERHDTMVQRMESLLAGKYGKVEKKESAQGTLLRAERGRFSLFGAYMIHASVLIIIAGGVVGSIFGFDGFIKLTEGDTIDSIKLKGNRGELKLNFAIRCDRFNVDYYENGLPREYRSDLTFFQNGRAVHSGSVRVNHPIAFGGIRFYQASYGTSPGGRITLAFGKPGEKIQRVTVGSGDAFALPDRRAQVRLLRVEENLMQMGPAVKLNVRSSNRDIQFWVFKEIEQIKKMNPGLLTYVPLLNPALFRPYIFSLDHMEIKYYTGLQAAYDPGIPIVTAGAFLLFAGFMVVFFTSHHQIRIEINTEGSLSGIRMAGKTNRDSRRMQRELERLKDEYENTGAGT